MTLLSLYPPIEPYKVHHLPVDATHTLYIEEVGNPHGLPIVYFHGGPGFGCDATNRRYFDPKHYRIILFDQRGAGRSLPFADITNNTTQHLVRDCEVIRCYLNIDQWIVFGGSWGSTLSLVYAEAYPERVLALILRGIFLGREEDIKWFFGKGGAQDIFPDHWQSFTAPIPEREQGNLLKAYHTRLLSDNEQIQMQAANAWVTWQATCATLKPNALLLEHVKNPAVALSAAKLECHYYLNHCFLAPNQILKNISVLQHKPCYIIHGRYDMIFTMSNAWVLHQAWKGSRLTVIDDGGHAANEPGITDALIKATKQLANDFSRESVGE